MTETSTSGGASPTASGGKGRRRRGAKPTDESSLPPEEQARRQRQRELRALALRLREQGKEYNRKKARGYRVKGDEGSRRPGGPGGRGRPGGAGTLAGGRGGRGERGGRGAAPRPPPPPITPPCDVVVVPLYWKQRAAEAGKVRAAAQAAARALRESGLSVEADLANEEMPGKRFLKWEMAGVKVRVEIGPEEATHRTAVVAVVADGPGSVARRETFKAGQGLVAEVWKALGRKKPPAGEPAAAPEARTAGDDEATGEVAAAEPSDRPAKRAKKKKETAEARAAPGTSAEEEDRGEVVPTSGAARLGAKEGADEPRTGDGSRDGVPPPEPEAPHGHFPRSGDDLDDDFALDDEGGDGAGKEAAGESDPEAEYDFEREEKAKRSEKARREREELEARAAGGSGGGGERGASQAVPAPPPRKTPKLVVFR